MSGAQGSAPASLTRAQWLAREPFTLMLGAGFFGFFSHTGFLQALEAAGLRPRRVVGCSAGALAGGLWSSGLSGDELARELLSLRREEFWDPGLPLGGLLKGRKFNRKLQQVLVNLVQNALDASPADGRVEVVVSTEHTDAVVEVRDQGQGLPVALAIARQHGGRLALLDGPRGGVRARLAVPLAGPPASSP